MRRLAEAISQVVTIERIVSQGTKILAIAILAIVLHQILRLALRRTARTIGKARALPAQEAQRLTTLLGLVSNTAAYVIFFLAVLMAMREVGVNTGPIMGAAGVVGLAVGFGAQNLVRDVVSGFFILLEGQYYVGDSVELNSVPGTVEEVGLRVTKLRRHDGTLLYLNNGLINSIVRYPAGGLPFILHVPAAESAAPAVEAALHEFDREFSAFTRPASRIESIPAAGPAGSVLRFQIYVAASRLQQTQEKLAPRLRASLERADITPLPEPADILLLPSTQGLV